MSFTEDGQARRPRVAWTTRIAGAIGATPWRGAVRIGIGAAMAGFVTACSTPGVGPGVARAPVGQPEPSLNPAAPAAQAAPGAPEWTELGGQPTDASLAQRPLPPPRTMRNMDQVRVQAAERMVLANAGRTYVGAPPDVLLAIPVLEVELNADGSVRRVSVMRPPRQAKDTTQLAINAVYRAAPYGDVSRLPRPWRFVETFLFDEARRFKPRTLTD